jgi:hypothetical protein
LSVPAGPPIDPGKHDVRYTGITIVLSPTTTPRSIRESICVETERLSAPTKEAKMVR